MYLAFELHGIHAVRFLLVGFYLSCGESGRRDVSEHESLCAGQSDQSGGYLVAVNGEIVEF